MTSDNNKELANHYFEDSNDSQQSANECDSKICEILITASLAFLAIIATLLGSQPDFSSSMTSVNKALLVKGIMFFTASVFVGIYHVMRVMKFFRHIGNMQEKVANHLVQDEPTMACMAREKIQENRSAGEVSLVVQIVLFAIGVICIVTQLCLAILFN